MDDLVKRLRETAEARKSAEPWDDPDHYLNVVARISREDGALMDEAAARIAELEQQAAGMENLMHKEHARADRLAGLLKEAGEALEHIMSFNAASPRTWEKEQIEAAARTILTRMEQEDASASVSSPPWPPQAQPSRS